VISDVQCFSTVISYGMGRRIDWYTYACFLKEARDAKTLNSIPQRSKSKPNAAELPSLPLPHNEKYNLILSVQSINSAHNTLSR